MVSMVSPFQELDPCAISCAKKICGSDLPVPPAPRARTLYFQKFQEKDRSFGGIIPGIDTRDKEPEKQDAARHGGNQEAGSG
jgi:hypothetical protein